MNVLAHDPLRVVDEALERAGCKPHGPHYKFTSRCPGHDDRNASLAVGVWSGRQMLDPLFRWL